MSAPKIKFEMRLCWSSSISHTAHDISLTNEWQPHFPGEHFDLEIMMKAGNEVYGRGTHWIELRNDHPFEGVPPLVDSKFVEEGPG